LKNIFFYFQKEWKKREKSKSLNATEIQVDELGHSWSIKEWKKK
jgi:hypothetical protein